MIVNLGPEAIDMIIYLLDTAIDEETDKDEPDDGKVAMLLDIKESLLEED